MAHRTSTIESKKTDSQPQKAAEENNRNSRRNQLILRLILSVVLLFLALFLLLGIFGVHALVLDLLQDAIKGLIGYGIWLLPIAFLYIAWMLFFLHKETIARRIVSAALLPFSVSALVHTFACRQTFSSGIRLAADLWKTGREGTSGGLIPGAVSQGLQWLISKGGTIPVLILITLILVILTLQISMSALLHRQAEKRREKLASRTPEEPEPKQDYDLQDDLHILATPIPREKTASKEKTAEKRHQKDFDLSLGETKQSDTKRESENDLLIFTENSKKKKQKKEEETSAFDIPLESDYTREVQNLVNQELEGAILPAAETDEFIDEILIDIPSQTTGAEPQEELKSDWAEWPNEIGSDSSDESEIQSELGTVWADWPDETESNSVDEPATSPMISDSDLKIVPEQKVTRSDASAAATSIAMEIAVHSEEKEELAYQYPPMSMLTEAMESKEDNTEEMRSNVRRLEETLESFGVDSKIINVVRGPAVTRYEMELKPGVKMSKITSLHEDIALSLGVSSVHVAAVPGKSSTIGIEVPNAIVTSVPIKEVLSSKEFQNHKSALAFAVGKDISGNYIIGDISKMPHLLIAGTTGSGKSVCMNSIIVSLLYRDSPDTCRLIMVDPKVVELSIYNGVPHLLIPVVTDPKKAAGALQWAVTEMERRYRCFEDIRVRDLAGYNKKANSDDSLEPMPRIVIIIDELADLMMVAAKEVETSIARLAAKARAAGMHLVIATQRPSADVITGVIKANIPSRIAFAVSSAMESNIIMGTRGAEKLLGKGDMFYAPQGTDKPYRVQGCFISDEEVEQVAEFVKSASEADYSQEILQEIEQNASISGSSMEESPALEDNDGDELLPEAVEVLLETKQASVSMLQRRMKLGYAHAARIVDEMEEKGIVGPFEGSKPRQLLITKEQWDTMVGVNPKATVPTNSSEMTSLDEDI